MSTLSKLLIPAVLFRVPAHAALTINPETREISGFVKALSIGLLFAIGLYAGYVPGEVDRVTSRNLPVLAMIFVSILPLAGEALLRIKRRQACLSPVSDEAALHSLMRHGYRTDIAANDRNDRCIKYPD